jgi:hypothetical protein
MTVPIAGDPPGPGASAEPTSFARLGWQLATPELCAQCDRRTDVCPTCTAALDELLAEERLLRAIDLYGQVTAWKCAGLLTTSTAMRLWSVIQPATRATDPSPSKPAESVATPTLAAADTTSQPPRPPFRWRDPGESLLAERTLNTLLDWVLI